MMPTAALALIYNNDPSLVLTVWSPKRKCFGLPGGKVEQGETPFKACVREVLEEVGLDIHISERVPLITRGVTSDRPIVVFEVDLWSGYPHQCERGCPISWMNIQHLIDEDAHPYANFYTEVFSYFVFGR